MKKRLTKFLSVLVCLTMFFASLSVFNVFASETDSNWLDASQINIPSEYDFSFMAIGDTQIVTRYDAKG